MSAEPAPDTPAPFGYFLNICSLMHFGYFSDAEKALNEFLDNKDEQLSKLTDVDRTHAIDTARELLLWVCAKQERRND